MVKYLVEERKSFHFELKRIDYILLSWPYFFFEAWEEQEKEGIYSSFLISKTKDNFELKFKKYEILCTGGDCCDSSVSA